MDSFNRAPISTSQRELLARLLKQGRVTVAWLEENHIAEMSRSELARFLDAHVLGSGADEKARDAIDALFAGAPTQTEEAVVA